MSQILLSIISLFLQSHLHYIPELGVHLNNFGSVIIHLSFPLNYGLDTNRGLFWLFLRHGFLPHSLPCIGSRIIHLSDSEICGFESNRPFIYSFCVLTHAIIFYGWVKKIGKVAGWKLADVITKIEISGLQGP